MPRRDWKSLFTLRRKARPASAFQLRIVADSIRAPVTRAEKVWYKGCAKWTLPNGPLPPAYLDFLSWSNGGEFWNGRRCFQFFATWDLRENMLCHSVPKYMPGSLPFALDGGGHFYLFDMRRPPVKGEYPILLAGCGDLDYEDALPVARTFVAVCKGKTDLLDRYLAWVVRPDEER
jgi:hypothetical protein